MKLDETDLKILRILQNNARVSARAIAEEVYVSAPTVAARIETMRREGVIRGYYTDVSPAAFGNTIRAYMDMEVTPGKRNELYEFLRNCPQVIECNRVTGEYSLLIELLFRNTDEMGKFINQVQHYGRTQTQIVFSTVINHRGPAIPEDLPE